MLLSDIAGVKSWLPSHPTAFDQFWMRDAHEVSEMEIQLFYARSGLSGLRNEAIDAIDQLQAALIIAAFNREIPNAPAALILHEVPSSPFLVDELVDGLTKLSPQRRKACLYALETRNDPERVASLSWKDAKQIKQLSQTAADILNTQAKTRHMKVPYVFWEWATEQIAAPLFELKWSIEQAFGCTWPELTQRYARMVNVHRGADAAHLMDLAENVSKN